MESGRDDWRANWFPFHFSCSLPSSWNRSDVAFDTGDLFHSGSWVASLSGSQMSCLLLLLAIHSQAPPSSNHHTTLCPAHALCVTTWGRAQRWWWVGRGQASASSCLYCSMIRGPGAFQSMSAGVISLFTPPRPTQPGSAQAKLSFLSLTTDNSQYNWMHRSHAQSRGFETHKTKAIESSIAIVHQGAAIHNSNVFRCRLYCLFGDGVCVMPLIPRLMKIWKLPRNEV